MTSIGDDWPNLTNWTNLTLDCQVEEDRLLMPYCEMLQCQQNRMPGGEYIGVALQVFSTTISASCLLVMKLSTDYEQGLPVCPCRRGSCTKSGWKWRFVAGWAANTASEMFISTLAFYFAPLSVLAPCTGVGILVSALLARSGWVPCFGFPPGFKEHLSLTEKVGLGVLLLGMVATSWFGPSSEFTGTYQSWQAEWSRPEVIVQFSITATYLGSWTSLLTMPCFRRVRPRGKSVVLALGSSLAAAAAGAYSQLFAKMVITAILRMMFFDDAAEVSSMWMTWAALGGLGCTAPLQIFLLHSALGAGEAAFTVPCFFVMIMTLTILCSGVFFREFECMSVSQRPPLPKRGHANIGLFCAAVLVVLTTMLFLSCKQEQKKSRKMAKMRQMHGLGKEGGGSTREASSDAPDSAEPTLQIGAGGAAPAPATTPAPAGAPAENPDYQNIKATQMSPMASSAGLAPDLTFVPPPTPPLASKSPKTPLPPLSSPPKAD